MATGCFDPKDNVLRQFRNYFALIGIKALAQDHNDKKWSARVFCYSWDIEQIKTFKENLITDLKIEYIVIDKLHRYRPKGFFQRLLFGNKRNFFKLEKIK